MMNLSTCCMSKQLFSLNYRKGNYCRFCRSIVITNTLQFTKLAYHNESVHNSDGPKVVYGNGKSSFSYFSSTLMWDSHRINQHLITICLFSFFSASSLLNFWFLTIFQRNLVFSVSFGRLVWEILFTLIEIKNGTGTICF